MYLLVVWFDKLSSRGVVECNVGDISCFGFIMQLFVKVFYILNSSL